MTNCRVAIKTFVIGAIFLAPAAVHATIDDVPVTVSAINLLDSFATEGKREKAVAIPIPSAFWRFGTALVGFVAISRRIKL